LSERVILDVHFSRIESMNPTETRPLPNAADKAALKAIAATVIQTCPSLQDTAHEVASDLLKKYGITDRDPDQVYFHRFDASQSSSKAFTGWEHVKATPTSSMTLTQLVIHRFRAADQDNADLLDVYAGFYTAGPNVGTFNETNEVRLHGNEVLKDFWSIDFSSLYTDKLTAFWNDSGSTFRTLAKCNFLIEAVKARDKRQLSDEDFQYVTDAVIGPITWPISLQLLQTQHPCAGSVRTLDVDGYVATNILRFVAPKGRQIVYLPGETDAFQVLETATDMHYWTLQQMNKEDARQAFMTHFSLGDRQAIAENITDIMNRLVSTWGKYDHHLINQKNQLVTGDAFSWLRDSTKDAMFAEAELSLTSSGDLREKLWIGYLSAGVKVFGPMAVVGWPIALPVIGASIVNLGLNIDQAVNGKTAAERKAGILGAVLSGIDILFNLLVLKGPGSLQEIGPEVDAAEAAEMADLIEATKPSKGIDLSNELLVEELDEGTPPSSTTSSVPDAFKIEERRGAETLVREPGKFHIQALIKGDWRVQMESPWAYRTPQDLRALLPEPGMFTFQRYRSSLLVVYRNAQNRMADSVIRLTPSGRLNLDIPLRPAYESMTVDTLDELKQTLIAKGMRPMGWPAELAETIEIVEPPEAAGAGSLIGELDSTLPDVQQRIEVPDHWQANELLEGQTPGSQPGKFQGIYQLNANPSTAILMNDTAYYVRYEADVNGGGHWAIIDPANPQSFSGSIPVRLNAEGEWETAPRGGLKGGGKTPAVPGTSSTRFADRAATTPLPASDYDVPAQLKPHLEEGAAGNNDIALRDVYDSMHEIDPYRDFKAIRKRLYRDAIRFYENPVLPSRPPIPQLDPAASAEEIIEKTLENARGLVIGESHDGIGSKQWLIENMELLASKNVKTLYMEHLLTDFHQAALDSFARTGVMPKELESYLKALDVGNMTDPLERYTFLEVVREAGKQGIHVQAIDCMASYRLNGMDIISGQERVIDETARQKMMNYFARSIIRTDQAARGAHKWAALMGNSHSNTFEGVAGVSELEEAIGIRVEDVAEGASTGIQVDPGKIMPLGSDVFDRAALVRGDLRLQVETPWRAQTMPEIEALLPRYGMYTLKQQPLMTYLVHRSRSKELVRTLIQTDAGRYYIERPNWPSVSGKRYGSVKELLQGLDNMGLRLAGWSKPL
jgi:hypothetical protein